MANGTCFDCLKSRLVISYINQDTSHLSETEKNLPKSREIDGANALFHVAQPGFWTQNSCKKYGGIFRGTEEKVLIAASLLTPAYLYLWHEPLNYIDVFSRMQIEKLIAVKRTRERKLQDFQKKSCQRLRS